MTGGRERYRNFHQSGSWSSIKSMYVIHALQIQVASTYGLGSLSRWTDNASTRKSASRTSVNTPLMVNAILSKSFLVQLYPTPRIPMHCCSCSCKLQHGGIWSKRFILLAIYYLFTALKRTVNILNYIFFHYSHLLGFCFPIASCNVTSSESELVNSIDIGEVDYRFSGRMYLTRFS